MNNKAFKYLLMFLFGQIVQTAIMLVGYALNMGSISWWTITLGLVIFCAAWLGSCAASPETAKPVKRHAKPAQAPQNRPARARSEDEYNDFIA